MHTSVSKLLTVFAAWLNCLISFNCSQLRTSNLQPLLQNRSDFNKRNCDCMRQTGGFEAETNLFIKCELTFLYRSFFSIHHNNNNTNKRWAGVFGGLGCRSGESTRLARLNEARRLRHMSMVFVLAQRVLLWFSSLNKNQHFQIPIRSRNARTPLKRVPREHFVDPWPG